MKCVLYAKAKDFASHVKLAYELQDIADWTCEHAGVNRFIQYGALTAPTVAICYDAECVWNAVANNPEQAYLEELVEKEIALWKNAPRLRELLAPQHR